MSKLREAAERVLCAMEAAGWDGSGTREALRAALSEPDLEGAVVEAARNLVNLRRRQQYDLGYSAEAAHLCMVVDALDAARRPRYEAYVAGMSKDGTVWNVCLGDAEKAQFYDDGVDGDAERHAKEWAARMNERGA